MSRPLVTQFDAHVWVRQQLPNRLRPRVLLGRAIGEFFKPTTADLRKLLKARTTPRVARNYIYTCLLYRRHWKVS